MPEVDIKDKDNKTVGKINLPDEVFGVTGKNGALHNSIVNYLANQRQGTHATKTKGLVSGGGKKPWKQKHTGRARSGSSRSPLWRGGGTIFGPQPRDYSYELPRQAKKVALRAALSGKIADGEVVVVDSLSIDKPSTKAMNAILAAFELTGKSTLIVLPEYNKAVLLSARNIPAVSVRVAAELNPYDLASHSRILMTRQAAESLAEAGTK